MIDVAEHGLRKAVSRKAPFGGSGKLRKGIIFLVLCVLAVMFLFPFFWIVSSALQTTQEQQSLPLTWVPSKAQWNNFQVAWNTLPFTRYLLNSLLIVTASTIGAVASSAWCAYGFARLRFMGRTVWFYITLSTLMLPGTLTMIPVYLIMKDLGWLNTYYPLIVPAWFGGGAYNIFLLHQFMKGIPVELEEAAKIDGASIVRIFFQIIVPSIKPALAIVAWGTALASWGDILGPIIYITDANKWTFAQAIQVFPGSMPAGWGSQLEMAIAVVFMIPVIVGFFLLQRWLIEGIQLAGVNR